ncbi:MAG: Ig-like domain-containing protein [Anaeromyxobacteraceae bacterium]
MTWTVAESGGGSVAGDGTYTAPSGPGVYHVVATSVADPTRQARCEITVTTGPQVVVTVSPHTASIVPGATWQFSASVTATNDSAVVWSVAEVGGGTVSATGLYTAPATGGTYHVTATARADGSKSDQAVVTVSEPPGPPPAVAVTISPRTAYMAAGETYQFAATVTGAGDTSVTWSVVESGSGTISTSGIYTAPAAAGTYHVKVTSRADTSKSDTAAVVVSATTPPPPSTGDLAAQLAALSTRAIAFGHQSVGTQIMSAVADLEASNPGPEPRLVQDARSASLLGKGIWGDFGVGENYFPVRKIDDFVGVMNGGAGSKVDVAFMKFCFVDFYDSSAYWSTGNEQTLFATYQAAMTSIRAANPGVTIVHFTVPLVTAPFSSTNGRREALSKLIRETYAGREPVFDIARVESTRSDGTRCTDGQGVPMLCSEYAIPGDDGHLNATAKPLVARALVALLASLP